MGTQGFTSSQVDISMIARTSPNKDKKPSESQSDLVLRKSGLVRFIIVTIARVSLSMFREFLGTLVCMFTDSDN